MDKKTIIAIFISTILALVIILGVFFHNSRKKIPSTNLNIKNETVTEKDISATEKTIQDEQLALEKKIAIEMIHNDKIAKYLSSLCRANEDNCPNNVFYAWKKDEENNIIAFISNLSEEKWKKNPFNYSPEIYKVNFQNGDIYRQSQYNGSFSYILNLQEINNN